MMNVAGLVSTGVKIEVLVLAAISWHLNKRLPSDARTDGPTDRRTRPPREMRGRKPRFLIGA